MPPKAKISKEMVIDAAFEVARAEGAENVNARTVAQKLGCSTQPVMYHFATIEELKRAVYEKADAYHTEYLMNMQKKQGSVMLKIGINYIRFAVEEPNLFRFLFQSGFAVQNSLLEMVNSEELIPVLSVMQEAMKMNLEQTKEIFVTLAMFVHGYASIITNNSLEYDEKLITTHLKRVYTGAVLALQEEKSMGEELKRD
ncbi:MAG: TetR/AcrR family transcriptional regulator [Clostridium sp.]|nr:TetR/AcrR family transcriptional regulator [Clostridium sp.]